ncbi:trypsin-like peptidase domain-containing protein [Streptomyces sp. RerS4]|uniref:nSTAND1 domain-containing NTPase n=1 Tax=Streptomyces sp. RerS4 TaxID=2942449 RepID=UPI00201C406D|nr:trypsin-like peptidase domain-containing protein [Streptomyces sp. RerS4]UQX00061.1 trypsin-like peptidase domain-containing protein [Streptomyces sp. RerS4]
MTTGAGSTHADAVLAAAIVRVGAAGAPAGVGFLIAPDLVLTCAHVVTDALGLPRTHPSAPTGVLALDRPLSGVPGLIDAEVAHWVPLREDGTGDIAVLRTPRPPAGVVPPPMASPASVWEHPVRVAGFPAAFPGGVWHAGRLRGRTAEDWVQLSGADQQGVPVDKGFSGSPVWDEEARAVVGMVVAAQLSGDRQSFVIPIETLVAEVPALAPVLSPDSPFRGLVTFQESDAGVYFGRDAEADEVTALLDAGPRPYVALVGPSGCGKSSLALAGVAPRLRARGHEVLVLRAADGLPVRTALAAELARLAHPELRGGPRAAALRELEDSLTRRGLLDTARLVLGTPTGRFLVVLDQAEALLAHARGTEGDEDGARLLFPEPPPAGLRVLVTLRADFLEAALSHPVLGPALDRAALRPLRPMSRAQLSEVILRPLSAIPAVSYDPGLVARMLDDAGVEPGALPLLGFVLARLWDERAAGRLRFDSYEEIGGVRGALGRHAEAAWQVCVSDADRDEALRLLTSLVRVLPGGEAPLRAVVSRAEAGEERWRIAGSLAERRILVVGGDPEHGQSVELAHEALIAAWPTLAGQVAENRAFLSWRAGFRRELEVWREHGRARDQLLTGAPLDAAVEQTGSRRAELTSEEAEFLDRSVARRAEEAAKRRRDRRRARVAVCVLVALLLVAGLATWRLRLANDRLDEDLRRAASPQLSALATRLDDVSVVTSSLMGAAAYRTAPSSEAKTVLLEQYLRMRHVERVVVEGKGDVEDAVLSEDTDQVTIGLSSGEVLIADLGEGPPRLSSPGNRQRLVTASPDGNAAASSGYQGQLRVGLRAKDGSWRQVELRGKEAARQNAQGATELRFDATGERVLAAVPGEGVRVWQAATGQRTGADLAPPAGWRVSHAWFGPGGESVIGRIVQEGAASTANGRLVRWQLSDGRRDDEPLPGQSGQSGQSGQPGQSAQSTQEVGAVTVSGDGSTLVRCTAEGTLQVWDLAGGPRVKRQYSTSQLGLVCPLYVPRLDRTGRFLINPAQRFGPALGHFRFLVLDLQEGLPSTLDLPAAAQTDEFLSGTGQPPVVSLAGPPDAMKVAFAVAGTLVTAPVPRPTSFDSAMMTSLIRTVDADHNRIATVDADGATLRLWDLKERRQLAAVRPSAPLARLYPAFSPDGRRLLTVTADGQGVLVWDLAPAGGGPVLAEARRITLPGPPGVDPARPDPRTGRTPAWVNVGFDGSDHAVISAVSYVSRWDLRTGTEAGRLYRPPVQEAAEVAGAAATVFAVPRPGHQQAAVRTINEQILLWDFERGAVVETIGVLRGPLRQMNFDAGGRLLAAVTVSGELQILDLERPLTGEDAKDGKWKWKVVSYQGVLWLNGFPTAGTVSTVGTANSFTFWDLESHAELYHFTPGYGATGDWSADGGALAWAEGSSVEVIPLDPERWRARACELAGRDLSAAEKRLLPTGSHSDACAGLPKP